MVLNYASVDNGSAVVCATSGTPSGVSSAPSNVLINSDEFAWMTGELPQQVTIKIGPHPPLCFVGWHVAYDYLSNPRIIQVAAGESPDDVIEVVQCEALPGAGSQVWELQTPIPEEWHYVRFKILASFGSDLAYINHVILYAEYPQSGVLASSVSREGLGERTHSRDKPEWSSQRVQAVTGEGSGAASLGGGAAPQGKMAQLLQDLDGDIRLLRPLRVMENSAVEELGKNPSVPPVGISTISSVPPVSFTPVPAPVDTSALPELAQRNEEVRQLTDRVATLERTVSQLRNDLQTTEWRAAARAEAAVSPLVRRELAAASEGRNTYIEFPDEALRAYVEELVTSRLYKYTKRIESHSTRQIEDHVDALIGEMGRAVDRRVDRHMRFHATSGNNSLSDDERVCVTGGLPKGAVETPKEFLSTKQRSKSQTKKTVRK